MVISGPWRRRIAPVASVVVTDVFVTLAPSLFVAVVDDWVVVSAGSVGVGLFPAIFVAVWGGAGVPVTVGGVAVGRVVPPVLGAPPEHFARATARASRSVMEVPGS